MLVQCLKKIIKELSTYSPRGDADAAYEMITSMKFIFILHLMMEIMGAISGEDIGRRPRGGCYK
jgi:hypothetical protein